MQTTLPRLLPLLVACFLVPAAANARELPPFDALAAAPLLPAARGPVVRMQAHRDERFGVPTFVRLDTPRPPLAGATPEKAALAHLRAMAPELGFADSGIDLARLQPTHRTAGGSSIVKYQGRAGGIEIFREEVKLLLDPQNALVAISGALLDVPAAKELPPFQRTPEEAIAAALADYDFPAEVATLLSRQAADQGEYRIFDLPEGASGSTGAQLTDAVRVKPVWFRLPTGLVPAWYLELFVADSADAPADAHSYVVSATDGTLLFRNNLVADAFSYRVWAETSSPYLPLPNPYGRGALPYPFSSETPLFEPPFVVPNLVTLDSAPFSQSDPWLTAGATETRGNNVDAYADLASPDGFGAGDLRAAVTATGVFDRTFDTGLSPQASSNQTAAAVTQLFYVTNFLHDWFYDAGFDEAAGNAQDDNYGRGGLAGDSMKAEGQDYNGTNNANMSTPADGQRPRMQMYLFDGKVSRSVTVNATQYAAGTADFAPSTADLTANMAVTVPADGCSAISTNLTGKIALIDRGNCTFLSKVQAAAAAGATGVIIADNVTASAPPQMSGDGTTTVTTPTLSVTLQDGTTFKGLIAGGSVSARMYIQSVGPMRDGTIDNEIITHEWGHYISNRLIGNANGLSTNLAGGLGEGWSDFHALLATVKDGDQAISSNTDFSGTYSTGQYAGVSLSADSYYFGFRRWPYSTDMAKNPLTYRHISSAEALPASPPHSSTSSDNAEVHNTGEVWAEMLWECYAGLLRDSGRLSFAQAQERMKRYLVSAYKLTPLNPTLLEARDALLSAMAAEDSQDVTLCATAFAKRGAGSGALDPTDRYSTTNAGVVESYTVTGALKVEVLGLADDLVACDSDGVLDNGEQGNLQVKVSNSGFVALADVALALSSTNLHVQFPGGATLPVSTSLAPFASATVNVPVKVRGLAASEKMDFTATASAAAVSSANASYTAWGQYDDSADSATDDVESTGTAWSVGTDRAGLTPWTRLDGGATGRFWRGADSASAGLSWLMSPPLQVASSGSLVLSFSHRFAFEADATDHWDGGVIQLSSDGGTTWTNLSNWVSLIYNGVINTTSDAGNPMRGQSGFVGTSVGYPQYKSKSIDLGSRFAGQTVRIRFVVGTDTAAGAEGWSIDNITLSGITNTPFLHTGLDANHCGAIQASAGSDQRALVSTAFATALSAKVTDFAGDPAANLPVVFAAPNSGASGSFSSGATLTATTNAGGIATASTFTANGTGGRYKVQANLQTPLASGAGFTLSNLTSAVSTCSGTNVTVSNRTYSAGESIACLGSVDITAGGQAVLLQSGATVEYRAPKVMLVSPFHASNGSWLNAKP